jgi:hypothetical protein
MQIETGFELRMTSSSDSPLQKPRSPPYFRRAGSEMMVGISMFGLQRRPKNVAVVALASKMARTIWALAAHERTYQPGYVGQRA